MVGCRYAPMRGLLADLLRQTLPGYDVLEAAGDQEALKAIRWGRVGVSVLDVRLAGRGMAGLVRRLKADAPGMPVLLLVDEMGSEYLDATGADAWLEKKKISDELPALVSRLAQSAGGKRSARGPQSDR